MSIEVENAVFGYGRREVVRVARLLAGPGKCIGIFGPNGAGKSTLVRGMCGLLPPMSGQVKIDASARIGYLPQARSLQLHWPMVGRDVAMLALSARRFGSWIRRVPPALQRALDDLKVADLVDRRFAELSGGQQQRLMLAGALADEPDVLVLDEPSTGLDVQSQTLLLDTVERAMKNGLCVILISHDFSDLLRLASEVLLLAPQDKAATTTTLHDPKALARSMFGQEVVV